MLNIEVLSRQHHRNTFDCGVTALNDYLAKTAFQHSEKGLSKTFVAVDKNLPFEIIGFFTLTLTEIDYDLLPETINKKLPRTVLPVIKLARLAIATSHQGCGIGKALLFEALNRSYQVHQLVGAIALFVDAKDKQAALFYQKFGFIPIPSYPLQLFLPFNVLAEVLNNSDNP